METGTVSRRSVVVALGGGTAGLLAAACGPLPTASPAPSQTRSYQGVTLQHVVKGSDAARLRLLQRAIDELFVPRYPGATVQLIPEVDIGYWQKLQTLLAAGTPPDSAQQDEYFMAHLIAKDELLELTPYQRQDRGFDLKGLAESAGRAGYYRGKLYGLPSIVFGPIIQYNREHFDEAGLPYPPADPKQGGWTWNRLREDARKLTKREGGQVVRAGFAFDARFLSRFSGHLYAYGARVMDRLDDPTKCVLDEPRAVELLQLLYDMRHRDQTAAPVAWDGAGERRPAALPGDNGTNFNQGKIAMSVQLSGLAGTNKAGLRWDYAPLPRPDDGAKPAGFIGANVYTGMRASKYPDLVWTWLAAGGGPDHEAWKVADPDILEIPAWKRNREAFARTRPPDHVAVNAELGDYATTSIMSTAYVELQDEILDGLRPAWRGEAPVRQVVAEVVRKANDLLRQAPQGPK
jgi:multiple sugar transport system substrate-binding protein